MKPRTFFPIAIALLVGAALGFCFAPQEAPAPAPEPEAKPEANSNRQAMTPDSTAPNDGVRKCTSLRICAMSIIYCR